MYEVKQDSDWFLGNQSCSWESFHMVADYVLRDTETDAVSAVAAYDRLSLPMALATVGLPKHSANCSRGLSQRKQLRERGRYFGEGLQGGGNHVLLGRCCWIVLDGVSGVRRRRKRGTCWKKSK